MFSWIVRFIENIPLASRRRIFLIYGLALIIGTHTPRVNFGKGFVISADKLLHVIAFMGLALLMMSACLGPGARRPFETRSILWGALFAFVWGGVTEMTQTLFVPGRMAHVLDVACNVIGVSAAIFVGFVLQWGMNARQSDDALDPSP